MTNPAPNGRRIEGTHLVIEFTDCDRDVLDDLARVESLLVTAAESIGATVVERVMHRFRPAGVTGCIILGESHLTIHTWPEAGYASVDLYTSRACDLEPVHELLGQGLRSGSSQTLVVDRGLAGPERIRVRGHRRVATHTLDCRQPHLPSGIYVGRSPGRGYGLFANREFVPGELIYDTPGTLFEWDAEFIVEHDLGRSVLNADSLGYELSPESLDVWPEQIRLTIGRHYGTESLSLELLHQCVTNDYEREVLITSFDGLKNHSSDPNTVMQWPDATIDFGDDGTPRWSIPTLAARPIRSDEELFVDYRASLSGYVPPADWLP